MDANPGVRVTDRRFSARKDWNPEDRSASRLPSVLEQLEDKIRAGEAHLADVREKARRIQQEAEQYRQRLERDIEKKLTLGRGDFLRDLLEVLDNFERSLEAIAGVPREVPGIAGLLEGLHLVRAQFLEKLSRFGVEKIGVAGLPYDPETAEAIDLVPTDDPLKDNIVLEVLQEGYRMQERVLRPARVRIARLTQTAAAPTAAEKENS